MKDLVGPNHLHVKSTEAEVMTISDRLAPARVAVPIRGFCFSCLGTSAEETFVPLRRVKCKPLYLYFEALGDFTMSLTSSDDLRNPGQTLKVGVQDTGASIAVPGNNRL